MRLTKQALFNFLKSNAKKYLLTSAKYGWFGNYASWNLAKQDTTGYDSDEIITKVKNALLKVKSGEAVYERDSVLFDEIHYSWGALAGLLYAGVENKGKLNVLDFGGSLGSGYFQNRKALSHLDSLQWNIIEQAHFVATGKENFQNNQLKFFEDYDTYLATNSTPDVLLLSSVIQYIEHPFQLLDMLLSKGIETVIIDITTFVDTELDIITVQKVPPHIYTASYPCWFFNKEKFIRYCNDKGYQKMGEWNFPYDLNMGYHAGILFTKV